jgi:hypothetical protein
MNASDQNVLGSWEGMMSELWGAWAAKLATPFVLVLLAGVFFATPAIYVVSLPTGAPLAFWWHLFFFCGLVLIMAAQIGLWFGLFIRTYERAGKTRVGSFGCLAYCRSC